MYSKAQSYCVVIFFTSKKLDRKMPAFSNIQDFVVTTLKTEVEKIMSVVYALETFQND